MKTSCINPQERIISKRILSTQGARATRYAVNQLFQKNELLLGTSNQIPFSIKKEICGAPYVEIIGSVRTPPLISITHTDSIAISLAIEGGQISTIGIDMERVRNFNTMTRNGFLTKNEQRDQEKSSYELKIDNTIRWCIKEAYLKSIKAGLRAHPKTIEIRGELCGSISLYRNGVFLENILVHWTRIFDNYIVAIVLEKV
ncbi:MAG TPA: 4'-phosphopantetheinyl transferase superfamily protein [Candidatus Paceibacterota bacterium]|nr:4'-phosphopantetheinyl transferase superfamily protein [Candidatus Paceibacterota bacterium]